MPVKPGRASGQATGWPRTGEQRRPRQRDGVDELVMHGGFPCVRPPGGHESRLQCMHAKGTPPNPNIPAHKMSNCLNLIIVATKIGNVKIIHLSHTRQEKVPGWSMGEI
jgi:hypothetical protein